ncbi:unnamed protein product [Rhizoctonia solani]|uniref:Uncharacterized protein n=1 Tax=Rhizoctonia solani TaxID=456999 RepID=A0A8H2WZ62_9AGAM|nr:unnamed protein product [Rhizoctonia solani]
MSDRTTNLKFMNSKLASPLGPLNKSIDGQNLDNPTTCSNLSDSKYLKESRGGGGCESGPAEAALGCSGATTLNSRDGDNTGQPSKSRASPGRVERLITKTPTAAKEALKTLPPSQKAEQIKNGSTIRARLSQEFFGKQPRRKKAKTSMPASTCPPTSANSTGATPEPVYDRVFFGVLQRTNSHHLQTWWRMLGFAKGRQGPVKVSKCIKALEAVGFQRRNGDGAQVTFNAPTEFEGGDQGLKLPSLTLHLRKGLSATFCAWLTNYLITSAHGANIEVVELKDKADSIKEKYPILVKTMRKMWEEI